jgi:hypothetical protein
MVMPKTEHDATPQPNRFDRRSRLIERQGSCTASLSDRGYSASPRLLLYGGAVGDSPRDGVLDGETVIASSIALLLARCPGSFSGAAPRGHEAFV